MRAVITSCWHTRARTRKRDIRERGEKGTKSKRKRERAREEVCTYRTAHWFARTVRSLSRILATSLVHELASASGCWRRWKWNLSGIRWILSVFTIWYQLLFLNPGTRLDVPSQIFRRSAGLYEILPYIIEIHGIIGLLISDCSRRGYIGYRSNWTSSELRKFV